MTSIVVAPIATLVAVFGGLSLGLQLIKVDDMCNLGRESLQIGGVMVAAACEKHQDKSFIMCRSRGRVGMWEFT